MKDLPTPEELGDMLKAGEISREEAVEIMSERARREAFSNLYGPMPGQQEEGASAATPTGMGRAGAMVAAAIIILLIVLFVLLQWLGG